MAAGDSPAWGRSCGTCHHARSRVRIKINCKSRGRVARDHMCTSMVRFGILGFGLHAVKRLMPGFALAQNCRVTGLSRRSLEKARESARQHNIPLAFDSAEELCRSPEVDAVLVTTPNACHLADVLLALRCGKPVLCEKPMGVHAGECRTMVEAARSARLLLGVAQVFRFEESTARLRDRVAAGQIGKVIFARSEFSFPGSAGTSARLDPRSRRGWRRARRRRRRPLRGRLALHPAG